MAQRRPPLETAMVRSGDVTLATTDHGGVADGPALVLLHGLGTSQRSMAKVAARLDGWRVITMDLRGHGKSTTADWTFAGVNDDIDAVIAHYGLHGPYVGGHSLGGMVGLQYAMAGHRVAGVINIDGWGPGVAERYVGEDPALVAARLDRIATGDLSSRAAQFLASLSRQGRQGTTRQVLSLLNRADVVAWHASCPVPSLAIHAVAPTGRIVRRLLGAEMARLQDAHRQGLRRDLAELARQNPNVSVVEIDATHQLITTHPDSVAAAIAAFHAQRH